MTTEPSTGPERAPRVDEALDHQRIRAVLDTYALAIDSRRWDLFRTLFVPEVVADYGSRHRSGLEAFAREFEAVHNEFDATHHVITNHLIVVDGDAARTCCYGRWRIIRAGDPGGDWWEGGGYYTDTLVRRDGAWLIATRRCQIVWWSGNPAVVGVPPDHPVDPIWNPTGTAREFADLLVDRTMPEGS